MNETHLNTELNPVKTSIENHLPQPAETEYVLHRRFDRMGRLVGDQTMMKLFNTHVMVIGLGGVGSWAAESLMRSGVGQMTVIDFDEVCITNTNRQLHALQGLVGKKKAQLVAERLQRINPQSKVEARVEFYNAESSESIFNLKPDYIVDCIDNLTAKIHLLNECKKRNVKVITSGGASARLDPSKVKLTDLGQTYMDPMAAQVRKLMRQKYEFNESKNWGIPCVFSDEEPRQPVELKYDKGQGFKCVCPQGQNNLHSCDNRNMIYGTSSFVTGAFGLMMASWVVRQVMES